MKRTVPSLLSLLAASTLALSLAAEPVKVIFDTDMLTDFDDVGALASLHALADAGECEILATVSCTRGNSSVAAIEVINGYYGRPDLPVGVPKGMGVSGGGPNCKSGVPLDHGSHAKYVMLARDYPQWVRHANSDDAPDANETYRRVLAAQPDGSVVICSVGFLTNLRRLLETKPDRFSPLDGRALVAKKVKKWVAMACNYPRGFEYNSRHDAESSRIVLAEWPTPAVFTDFQYGMDTYAGRAVAEQEGPRNPVKDVFRGNIPFELIDREPAKAMSRHFGKAGRSAWDETAVLIAVRGETSYFNVHRGAYRMTGAAGENEWVPDEEKGPHLRVTERTNKLEVGRLIDELICRGPRKRAAAVLPESLMRRHFEAFNREDDEIYTNAFPNVRAAETVGREVPLFSCPDADVERTYYYRWWTYRKHLRRTAAGGWVVTEFLPNVGWAGPENTIACPFGHHLREGRWLRNPAYLDGYVSFMLEQGRINGPRAYASWPAWGTLERAKVTGDFAFAERRLAAFVRNYEAWAEGWTIGGLSLKDVPNEQGARGVPVKTGFRADRGLFDFAGDREGSEFALSYDGARPMVNAAMWAEASAIAALARRTGDAATADLFAKRAADLERNIKAKLWNAEKKFFVALSVDGVQDDVCELHGYAPFYFGMPLGASYAAAWAPLVKETGFAAPAGLTFPARETPGFDLSVDLKRHECLWNGPSWPYATSVALTALYETLQAGAELPVSAADFARLVRQYARQHVLTLPDGRKIPWIDENLDPMTGEWIARRHMLDWERTGMRKLKYRERGKDYNHSTFCDLVIAGLCGFVPQADGAIVLRPLAPAEWDWWCVDGIRYHGHDVTVLFDRDGTRYGRGRGLVVLKDGARVSR